MAKVAYEPALCCPIVKAVADMTYGNGDAKKLLARSGCIEAMITILGMYSTAADSYYGSRAMRVISELSTNRESIDHLDVNGGLSRLVTAAASHCTYDVDSAINYCWAVFQSIGHSTDLAHGFGANGGCLVVVAALKRYGEQEKVLAEYAGKAVKALATLPANKAMLVQEGTAAVLNRVIRAHGASSEVRASCQQALASLS